MLRAHHSICKDGIVFPQAFYFTFITIQVHAPFYCALPLFLQSLGRSSQLAHSTDALNNSVFSTNLVALLFTLFHVTLAYPTFILLLHACLVSLKAFGQELCQSPFGSCRLCQLDHVYTHACQPSPLKNSRDFQEVGFPLKTQSWFLPCISYLYIHCDMLLLLEFLRIGLVYTPGCWAWLPSSPWDLFYICHCISQSVTNPTQSKRLTTAITNLAISPSSSSTAFG